MEEAVWSVARMTLTAAERTVPVPVCQSQIPHDLSWDRT
jgi:hypothetical protein